MKIEKSLVLEYMKPKVKALGFKKDILEGIAADIADNLEEVEDDASEEVINAKIKVAVDAVIPSLKLAQRLTNQGIEEFRKKQEKANEKKEDEKGVEKTQEKSEVVPSSQKSTETEEKNNETPDWARALIESNRQSIETIKALQEEIAGIKSKSATDVRRAKLEELLKDTGTFGKSTLKSFERIKFDTEDAFTEFFNDVKGDLDQLNQERANEGLGKFGAPQVETKNTEPAKPKPLTEAELNDLAETL